MRCNGQLSLEYLIVLGAFLSMLLLFMPLLTKTYHTGIFGLEAVKAEKFANTFKNRVSELSILGEGSKYRLTVSPVLEWKLSLQKNKLTIIIKSTELETEKSIETEIKNISNNFTKIIYNDTVILLENKNEKILVTFT